MTTSSDDFQLFIHRTSLLCQHLVPGGQPVLMRNKPCVTTRMTAVYQQFATICTETNYKRDKYDCGDGNMTKKELKRMSRVELLELLLEIDQENERLSEENKKLRAQLNARRIQLEQAGSIAEAALALNHVFEVAQSAADQYLESIRALDNGGALDE